MNVHFNKVEEKLLTSLRRVALAMFRKNFFGIFHGSISAKLNHEYFIINKRQAVFDDLNPDNLITLSARKDYRWNEASIDAEIHAKIYKMHKNAKFIAYAMPPYSVSYSLKYDILKPIDFFGQMILGQEIKILDPGAYQTWYQRANEEIATNMAENNQAFLIIKGYGIYALDRDLYSLAKTIALIENTCKILHLNADLMNHNLT